MTRTELLARALGLWPGTQWLLTAFPDWLIPFVPFFGTLGLWLFLRLFVELRRPQLRKQYRGLWPGDLFLSFSLGILMLGAVYTIDPTHISVFWQSPIWNVSTLLVILLVVGVLAVAEYVAAIKHPSHSASYTLYQLHTPTCLGHRVSMAVIAYLYMKVGIPALFTGSVPLLFKVLALLAFAGWFGAIVLDNTRPRPTDKDAIHPLTRAWFRIGRRRPTSRKPVANVRPNRDHEDDEFDYVPYPDSRRTSWADEPDMLYGDPTPGGAVRTGTVYAPQPLDDTSQFPRFGEHQVVERSEPTVRPRLIGKGGSDSLDGDGPPPPRPGPSRVRRSNPTPHRPSGGTPGGSDVI